MGKAAIFLATGFEEIEAVSIIDVLKRGEVEIDIVSVSGNELVEGSHGIAIKSDQLFYDIDFSEYDLLILPGGMPGTINLSKHEGLCSLLKEFDEYEKNIAAICAAPTILGKLNLLKGKKATCYPGYEDELVGSILINSDVVKDGNIITGKGAGVAIKFSLEILKLYKDTYFIEKLRQSLILN